MGTSDVDYLVPTPKADPQAFKQVVAGGQHSCGLKADGSAYC